MFNIDYELNEKIHATIINPYLTKDNLTLLDRKNFKDVQTVTDQISELESECDSLRRDVERRIYSETLIPEIRGDVLGMLENLDKIPGQIQGNAHSFNTEKPSVDEELNSNQKLTNKFVN